MAKRRRYNPEYKLKVVAHAEKNGNRAASREFGIDEKSVREWRQKKALLFSKIPQTKLDSTVKRRSYPAEYKLKVVEYAEEHGNRAASRKFGNDEKCVRQWRQSKVLLSVLKPEMKACRGQLPKWPQLEENLKQWILCQEQSNSLTVILHKAREIANELQIFDFVGSNNWVHNFMRRNSLSYPIEVQVELTEIE